MAKDHEKIKLVNEVFDMDAELTNETLDGMSREELVMALCAMRGYARQVSSAYRELKGLIAMLLRAVG